MEFNMANQNVIQLKQNTKPVTRKVRRRSKALMLRRHAPTVGLGAVILVLLYLSLNHLARGITIVTSTSEWEGTAMAIGIDLLIVALECAMVATVGTKSYKSVARFANPALIVAFLWSAGLNAFAFSAETTVLWMSIVAAALGASIPGLIYAGTRSWAALAISARTA
jgi:hypothetical protein